MQDLKDSGQIEEYLKNGGETLGKAWFEFYEQIRFKFEIDSIAQLKKMTEKIQSGMIIWRQPVKTFRKTPKKLTVADAIAMIKRHNFYDSSDNEEGEGFPHQYEEKTLAGDRVVMDHATGLMWQQGGSDKYMKYEDAKKWLADLNRKGYAGYNDWRLPTLEEGMSLMEPMQKNGDFYIDPVFSDVQRYIWTCDPWEGEGGSAAWVVGFSGGFCHGDYYGSYGCVRAVR